MEINNTLLYGVTLVMPVTAIIILYAYAIYKSIKMETEFTSMVEKKFAEIQKDLNKLQNLEGKIKNE